MRVLTVQRAKGPGKGTGNGAGIAISTGVFREVEDRFAWETGL